MPHQGKGRVSGVPSLHGRDPVMLPGVPSNPTYVLLLSAQWSSYNVKVEIA